MKNCLGVDCPYCNEMSCRICQPNDHLRGVYSGLIFSCRHSIHGRHDDNAAWPLMPTTLAARRRAWFCLDCGNWHEYVQPRTLHLRAYVETNRIDEYSDMFDQYTHCSRYFPKLRLRNGPETARCKATGQYRVILNT